LRDLAVSVFNSTYFKATEDQVRKLEENMGLIQKSGLSKLNDRLVSARRNVWDVFAEHNFTSELINFHDSSVKVEYEPSDLKYPVDLKIECEGVKYWVQIKRAGSLEKDNRRSKYLKEIIRKAKTISVPKFFTCNLDQDFIRDDIDPLIEFIEQNSSKENDRTEHTFFVDGKRKAIVRFWKPNKLEFKCLTFGLGGDIEVTDITGQVEGQIKGGLRKAAEAFIWPCDERNINLIAISGDNQFDIDFCDAVFGNEYEILSDAGSHWSRKENGLYCDKDFQERVAGIVVFRREDIYEPVCNSVKLLLVNPNQSKKVNSIFSVIPVAKVVDYSMRPTMGRGNFF